MNTHKNPSCRSRGQSLIEFALLLPVLLLLVLGALDLGRMFFTKIVITNAAREGANYLAFNRDLDPNSDQQEQKDNAEAAAREEAKSSTVDWAALEINFLNCCTSGERVGASVTTTVDLIFGSFLQSVGLLNGPMTLNSTVWMVVQ